MTMTAISNEQARHALARILRSPEFRRSDPLAQLGDFLRRLVERLGWHGTGPSAVGIRHWLLAAAILIFLTGLGLVIYLARMSGPFRSLFTPDIQEKKTTARAADRTSPASLLAAAERAAAEENFRSALRDLYLSLLLELDSRGLVCARTAKTNREYLREIVQKDAGLEQPFRSLVNLFEFKWYGLEMCSEADFRAGRELYAVLVGSGDHG